MGPSYVDMESPETVPQGLKPRLFHAIQGSTKVVPFQNTKDDLYDTIR